jgi:hypothetical protein
MQHKFVHVLIGALLVATGDFVLSAPAQDRTLQPGQPTQGKIWIQNRGAAEAIPVSLQEVASETPPLRVEVTGAPTVSLRSETLVPVRMTRQLWEYREISVPTGKDPVSALNTAGADGWEATGMMIQSSNGTIVIVKRPR